MKIFLFGLVLFSFAFFANVLAAPYSEKIAKEIQLGNIPSFSNVKSSYRPSEGILLDNRGQVLQTLRLEKKFRRLEWTHSSEIPEIFILSFLAQEDRRFPFHGGVDYLAILGSLKDRILGNSKRGASTITMQVAGFLLGTKPGGRSISDKFSQVSLAMELEKTWTKPQIAEAYWNLVPFKGEYLGVRAASRGIFGVDPSSLAPEQSILLVSLLPSPNSSGSKWESRACALSKIVSDTPLCKEIALAISEYKKPKSVWNTDTYKAYHAASRIFQAEEFSLELIQTGRIKTTIDLFLQTKAENAADRILSSIREKNAKEAGIIALDNRTGAILIYIGNSKLSPENYFVDSVRARRQAGSTLKPFLYSYAFEKNIIDSESILLDQPKEWELLGGSYKPSNYDDKYWGPVPAKMALASSLNIPAVQVLEWVGVPNFVSKLQELGFQKLQRPDFYGLSLALGSADVTLWELTNAYRTLANDGYYGEPTFFPEEAVQNRKFWESSREAGFSSVFDPEVAMKIRKILSSRDNRAPSFGWESNLSTRFFSFAKTGTSQDMRDNWCIGSSGKYTVGVWVGNMSGEPMHDVSGITGAAPLWKEVMGFLEEYDPSEPIFAKDEEKLPSSFIVLKNVPGQAKVLYPENGNLFALDPEIPEENERIRFKVRIHSKHTEWILNGKILARTNTTYFDWKPKRGNYLLSVRGEDGLLSETVAFQVR